MEVSASLKVSPHGSGAAQDSVPGRDPSPSRQAELP